MPLKSSDLHKVWSAPDNTRLTSKQFSFRLPVHVAAKISALCEMYPQRTRTEIVGDLLATALEGVVAGFPQEKGEPFHKDQDTGEIFYKDIGPRLEFYSLANKHYHELEKETGNDAPTNLYSGEPAVSESELSNK